MSERVSLDPTQLDSPATPLPDAEATEPSSDRPSVSLNLTSADAGELAPETFLGATALMDMSNFSVDSYANHLMDELFVDLERSLEPGASLPTEPVKPPEPVFQASSLPAMILSSLMPRQESELEKLERLHKLDTTDDIDISSLEPLPASGELTETQDAIAPSPQRRGLSQSFDQLLFAIACASLVATAALWVVFRNTGEQAVPVASAPAGQTQTAPADTSFLNYIQRSLNNIDRRTEANRQIASATGNTPATVASVPGTPPTPGANPTVLERVYIPVYQPPQAIASAPNAPPSTIPSTVTLPPVPGAPASQPTVAAAPTSIPNIAPSATHLLVGLLEQGDRSVALFEINGAVQRIHIGESIGSSGWALVSVSNSEAIVRRNGEVRSIFVGQQF